MHLGDPLVVASEAVLDDGEIRLRVNDRRGLPVVERDVSVGADGGPSAGGLFPCFGDVAGVLPDHGGAAGEVFGLQPVEFVEMIPEDLQVSPIEDDQLPRQLPPIPGMHLLEVEPDEVAGFVGEAAKHGGSAFAGELVVVDDEQGAIRRGGPLKGEGMDSPEGGGVERF